MKYKVPVFVLFTLLLIGFSRSADARLLFSSEDPEWNGTEFVIDIADEAAVNVDLKFGNTATGRIRFDVVNDNFEINKNVDFELNELVNARLENLGSAPTCNAGAIGQVYFDTTSTTSFLCTGTIWVPLNKALTDSDGDTKIQVEESADDDSIRFDTAGTERMIIDQNGNIGINVLNPTEEFQISGDISVGSATETIEDGGFVLNGNDVFIADTLGVEGGIYTDDTQTKYQFLEFYGCVRDSAASGTVAGGNSPVIRLDYLTDSEIRCSFPVPDDWISGTDINIETFWSPSNNLSGDVDFDLNYASFAVSDTIDAVDFSDTILNTTYETVATSTQLDLYKMVADIPSGDIASDEMVNINLARTPGDIGDTYLGDINIHMVRISYTGKKLR